MNLMYVFDGRTDANEYYWFVLAVSDNAEELILTMPTARVSDDIKTRFEDIQSAYLAAREADLNRSAEQVAKEVGEQLGFNLWTTITRD